MDPRNYTWDGTPSDPWYAEIWRQKVQTKADITTFLLEGTYSPSATPYNATHGPRVIIPFSGDDVKAALAAKLPYHMGILIPGKYRIKLEITGNLKAEYGGTPFRGSGVIVVTIPNPPPP